MSLDFTLSKYQELCQAILASGYSIWPIARFLTSQDIPELVVLLRHDVDRWPTHALQMARLEYELDIQSTYYIRMTRLVFRPAILTEIASMGHEIGYHYETLAKTRGNMERAITLFEQELEQLRQVCEIQTISMHGRPLSPYDSRDLWQRYNFQEFSLLGEAYLSLDYKNLVYLTDTGRSWFEDQHNIRDKVTQDHLGLDTIKTTNELITAICEQCFSHMCIQTHPERWAANSSEWLLSKGMDFMVNQIKNIIALQRNKPK